MKKTKYTCDICKHSIQFGRTILKREYVEIRELETDSIYVRLHLCKDCLRQLKTAVDIY